MKITRLAFQKNDPTRVSIYVDGKYAFSLGSDQILELKVFQGKELDQAEYATLRREVARVA